MKRSSILCALVALALVECKADGDASDGSPRGTVAEPGATGGAGGAPTGSGGLAAAAAGNSGSAGAAGMAGTAGMGTASMGAGGMGSGGKTGTGGMGSGGMGSGGMTGTGGIGTGGMGSGGMTGTGGMGSGGASGGDTETGKLVGMTAAHNAVRAMVNTTPPLPPMKWSAEIAEYAQEWTDMLAVTCDPQHRTTHKYGENLAAYFSNQPAVGSTAQDAVDGWAGEVACWTYGAFGATDKCDMTCTSQMFSDGCGHYTQVVWRDSVELGCGFSTCMKSGQYTEIWICNYGPPGNVLGTKPY